jgi:peptidoglycan/LPS O-acetylase OafA/YrhL
MGHGAPAGSGGTGPAEHLHGLDGLRGLAALAVLALHVSFYADRPWSSPVVGGMWGGLRLGVVLFFVLSAFLLSLPWLRAARGDRPRPQVGAYLLHRVARVLPAYYAALVFAAVVLAGTGSPRLPVARDVPLIVGLVHNWSDRARGALVPPSWTLCVELSFYLLLPLLGLLACRWARSVPRQLLVCAAIVAASAVFNAAIELAGLPRYWHGTLPSVAYAFAIGMAAAAVAAARRPGPGMRGGLIGLGAVLVIADAVAHGPLDAPGTGFWRDLPAAVGFAAIVLGVASRPGRLLDSRPLRRLGSRSYGLYLFHYPVILALGARGQLPRDLLPALALVLIVTLVLAELSWRGIEEPARRLARTTARRRTRRARGTRRADWVAVGRSPS